MYKWKVNMSNGISHIVTTDISDVGEMVNALFGKQNGVLLVSSWKVADNKNYNSVIISSTNISSIEYGSK